MTCICIGQAEQPYQIPSKSSIDASLVSYMHVFLSDVDSISPLLTVHLFLEGWTRQCIDILSLKLHSSDMF